MTGGEERHSLHWRGRRSQSEDLRADLGPSTSYVQDPTCPHEWQSQVSFAWKQEGEVGSYACGVFRAALSMGFLPHGAPAPQGCCIVTAPAPQPGCRWRPCRT